MKKALVTIITVILTITGVSLAQDVSAIKKQLEKDFPNFQFDEVRPMDVGPIYEISTGTKVFYYSPKGYIFFGEIWSKDGRSLTQQRIQELTAKKVKDLPLDKAIKIGNGKNEVVEIIDPDCPFCRRVHKFFKERTDVTRYVFFYPLNFHPHAKEKALYILCSKDKVRTFDEVMLGEYDEKEIKLPGSCEEAKKTLEVHMKVAKDLGVRGTPVLLVNGIRVNGANTFRIENILRKSNEERG